MGDLSNGSMVMGEDCSARDYTRAVLAQQQHASPQQYSGNGEEEMVDEETGKECCDRKSGKENNQNHNSLKQQVSDLTIQMTYLSHQVTLLLNAFHVPSCPCAICQPYYQTQVEMLKMFENNAPTPTTAQQLSPAKVPDNKPMDVTQNGFIEKRPAKIEVPTSSVETVTVPTSDVQPIPNVPTVNDCEALLSQIFASTGLPSISSAQVAAAAAAAAAATRLPAAAYSLAAAAAANNSFAKSFGTTSTTSTHQNVSSGGGGRRSKYCSAEEKKAVADYAEVHGASAAGRKFNIPTPVAAYYHRKEYRKPPSVATFTSLRQPPVNAASPGTTSGDDVDSTNGDCHNGAVSNSARSATGSNAISRPAEQQPKPNPAHSTGSPGFLRGRGRGRPKLIGDELDAELVDYMVQVKQNDPRGHLTASQALAIAREYIMEKAPGLLAEHGGQIKLKLTWAMKLVTRVGEREKEIELGLPAGSISNMTRSMTNASLPGGNFMADMVAQNLLSQQMTQIMNQALTGSTPPATAAATAAAASATPQILNVRELELPKPDDGDLKGEIVDATDNDTKEEDMDATEQPFDTDIEYQAGDMGGQTSRNNATVQQHFIPTNAF